MRLDAIADNYAAVMPMIREAIEKRDDLALGYRSPGEYVADRFGGSLQRLGVDVRRAVVGELTAAGMSTRAIGTVLNVGNATVFRDQRAGVSSETPQHHQAPEREEASVAISSESGDVDELDSASTPEPTPAPVRRKASGSGRRGAVLGAGRVYVLPSRPVTFCLRPNGRFGNRLGVSPMGDTPQPNNERQARELFGLPVSDVMLGTLGLSTDSTPSKRSGDREDVCVPLDPGRWPRRRLDRPLPPGYSGGYLDALAPGLVGPEVADAYIERGMDSAIRWLAAVPRH